MKLIWQCVHLKTMEKFIFLLLEYESKDVFGRIQFIYNRNNRSWKYRIYHARNEKNVQEDELNTFVLTSLEEEKQANGHFSYIEYLNSDFIKDITTKKINLVHKRANMYEIFIDDFSHTFFTKLNSDHTMTKFWMNYEKSEIDLLEMIDDTTQEKVNKKIHQNLRVRELFNKKDEL